MSRDLLKIDFVKLHPNALVPGHETLGAAGVDLTAISIDQHEYFTEYRTGLAIELPVGYVGLVFPRSSISKLPGMALANAVGVIDSDYRGEIMCRFRGSEYGVGDRIAQLVVMPYQQVWFSQVAELSETSRGAGGFGSTGK